MTDVWDLRKLRLLHELQQRGTVAAVAAALSYSPSTVSQQLSQLQREVGVTLLRHEGRNLRLTSHGEAVAAHAARALDLEEEVRGQLEAVGAPLAPVRIASLQTAAHALLPEALGVLAGNAPDLRVEIAVIPPEQGLFELEAHGFDLVLAEEYPGHTRPLRDDLVRTHLGQDLVQLAVPRHNAVATLTDASRLPWIMEPVGTAARSWAVQQCRAAGFEPDVRFEADDLGAHLEFIAAGHAAGILPGLARARAKPAIRLIDLPGNPHRDLFVSTRRVGLDRPGVRTVIDALGATFRELSGSSQDPTGPRPEHGRQSIG